VHSSVLVACQCQCNSLPTDIRNGATDIQKEAEDIMCANTFTDTYFHNCFLTVTQLSQRGNVMLSVTECFNKSLGVTQGHSK